MSYEEKGAWVYLVATVGTALIYVLIILSRAGTIPLAEVPYVSTLVWMICISIGLSIVGRIMLEILNPSERLRADERDREVNRRGEYVGGIALGVGMIAPFALTLAQARHFWIGNAIYLVFVVAALVGVAVKLVAYRRGL